MTDSYVPEVESRQFWDVPNDRFGSLPDAQYTLAECLLSGVKQPFSDSVLRGRFRPEAAVRYLSSKGLLAAISGR